VTVRFTALAREEAAAAALAFAHRDRRTVAGFRDTLQSAAATLAGNPHLGRVIHGTDFRQFSLRPYPYLLIYEVRGQAVWIVRIPHVSQSPSGWSPNS